MLFFRSFQRRMSRRAKIPRRHHRTFLHSVLPCRIQLSLLQCLFGNSTRIIHRTEHSRHWYCRSRNGIERSSQLFNSSGLNAALASATIWWGQNARSWLLSFAWMRRRWKFGFRTDGSNTASRASTSHQAAAPKRAATVIRMEERNRNLETDDLTCICLWSNLLQLHVFCYSSNKLDKLFYFSRI